MYPPPQPTWLTAHLVNENDAPGTLHAPGEAFDLAVYDNETDTLWGISSITIDNQKTLHVGYYAFGAHDDVTGIGRDDAEDTIDIPPNHPLYHALLTNYPYGIQER